MLRGSKIIAFVATTDSEKARAFYEGALGLNFVDDDEFATVLESNDVQLRFHKLRCWRRSPTLCLVGLLLQSRMS
jgi:hypothetical protein